LHERMAKEKATMASSAATATGKLWVARTPTPASWNIPCSNFGVIALCHLAAGSALSKAWKRVRAKGRNWAKPLMCMWLGLRCIRNALATWLVASRTVPATTGFLRCPSSRPLGAQLAFWRQEKKARQKSSPSTADRPAGKGSALSPDWWQNPWTATVSMSGYVFRCCLPVCCQDDAVISSVDETHDKILAGSCQPFPECWPNLPIPKGQESDQTSLLGWQATVRFIEMPSLAFVRSPCQRGRSLRALCRGF
jgi:hypothetical protein